MIEIPTEPTQAITTGPKSLVIYGPPKIGKTSIISKLPGKALLVDCEDGSDYVTCIKKKIRTFAELKDICTQLAADKKFEYVIFDTVDAVEEWCEIRATMLYKNSPTGKNFTGRSCLELPMGSGYLWLRTAFHEALDLMLKSAPKVILLGHVRDKMLSQAGKEVSAADLDLTGKIKNIVTSRTDAIGYAYRDATGKLFISFQTKDTVCCGARAEHLKNAIISFTYPEATAEDWRKIYNE
jgi:hypothetical protein